MQTQNLTYSLPSHGMTFVANCYALGQLKSKIQIYCRQFGISDEDSLALIIAGTGRDLGIGTPEEIMEKANRAFLNLPESDNPINLTDVN